MLIYGTFPAQPGEVILPHEVELRLSLLQRSGARDELMLYARDLGKAVGIELFAHTPIDFDTESTSKVLGIAASIWEGHSVLSHIPGNSGFVQGIAEAHQDYNRTLDELGAAI